MLGQGGVFRRMLPLAFQSFLPMDSCFSVGMKGKRANDQVVGQGGVFRRMLPACVLCVRRASVGPASVTFLAHGKLDLCVRRASVGPYRTIPARSLFREMGGFDEEKWLFFLISV